MSAVRLTRRLVHEALVKLPDGAGGFTKDWQPLGEVWAEIAPGTGREAGGVEVVLTQVPLRITVRGAPFGTDRRPVAGQRFREGARVLAILAVAERDADGRYLTCFAREEEPR